MEECIFFNQEDIEFELPEQSNVCQWIQRVANKEGKEIEAISYIFCSDAYLHNINMEYLQHDTYTDIITFPYSESPIEGDIFISIDRVKENALKYNVSFEQELKRVMIHGILHLCGYKDKSIEEETLMRQKEDESLNLFHI